MNTYPLSTEEANQRKRKYEQKKKELMKETLAIKPHCVVNHQTQHGDNIFKQAYKIPEDTLIEMNDGEFITYQNLEERLFKLSEALTRISYVFRDDLSGYSFL